MSNDNPNPYGFNFGNTNMRNSMVSIGSNIKRGNVEISSVYDPRRSNTSATGSNFENSSIDINSNKEEGDVTIRDVPLIPMPGRAPGNAPGRGPPVRPPAAPVFLNRAAPVVPNRATPPVQSSGGSSSGPSSSPAFTRPGDTTFLVEGTEIKAFKVVLSTKSKIFDRKIKNAPPNGKITLPNVKAATFEAMLQYFEDESCDAVKRNAADLLSLADKYEIPDLKAKVETILVKDLAYASAAQYLLLAHRNNAAKLKAKAIDYINGCPSIKESDDFRAILDEEPKLEAEFD